MHSDDIVQEVLQVPDGWVDSPEQAQLRACLIDALSGHDAVTTMAIAGQLIDFLRDHLMAGAAVIRRKSARQAKLDTGLTIKDLATASGQSHQAVARLINESK